jgi:hypothetical protein
MGCRSQSKPRGGEFAILPIAQARRSVLKFARLWLQAVHIRSLAVALAVRILSLSQINGLRL